MKIQKLDLRWVIVDHWSEVKQTNKATPCWALECKGCRAENTTFYNIVEYEWTLPSGSTHTFVTCSSQRYTRLIENCKRLFSKISRRQILLTGRKGNLVLFKRAPCSFDIKNLKYRFKFHQSDKSISVNLARKIRAEISKPDQCKRRKNPLWQVSKVRLYQFDWSRVRFCIPW